MSKRRRRRFKVVAFTRMSNPIARVTSGFQSRFVVHRRMTRPQARLAVKELKFVFPKEFAFRIRQSNKKGMTGISLFLGLALFIFCLAIANSTGDIFSLSKAAEE